MLVIKTNETASGTFEYLEKDYGVIRGITTGLLDFTHPDTIADLTIGSITALSNVYDLINTGGTGTVNGSNASLTNTGIEGGRDTSLEAPSGFIYANDGSVTEAVQICWMSVDKENPRDSSNSVIFGNYWGDMNNAADNFGSLRAALDVGTDVVTATSMTWNVLGSGFDLPVSVIDDLDSGMQQLAVYFVNNGDSTATMTFYKNGSLVTTATRPLGTHNTGSGRFDIGGRGSFSDRPNPSLVVGRMNFANLTGVTSITAEEYIQRDWNHARGYFGL